VDDHADGVDKGGALMCGRYRLSTKAASLQALLETTLEDGPQDVIWPALLGTPRYNVCPTQEMPIVRQGRRSVDVARWGIEVGPVGKSTLVINARIESLTEKPTFQRLWPNHRCLVPVDGFYEWRGSGVHKTPFLFALPDDAPFFLAGLWSPSTTPASSTSTSTSTPSLPSFAIITTPPNALLAQFHDRMPLIVTDPKLWFADDVDLTALTPPQPVPALAARPVSKKLGNPENDDASVLEAPLTLF
jgi:putative SOS response-associated peptidase YedK